MNMRRFHIDTIMVLVVIVALCIALVVQHDRASLREAELQARLAQSWPLVLKQQQQKQQKENDDVYMNLLAEGMKQKYREKLRGETEAKQREK